MLIMAILLAQAPAAAPTPDPSRYLLIKKDHRTGRPSGLKPVAPIFPSNLLGAVQVTTVVVEVVVDEQARVTRARVVKGDSRAHEAALRAAIQWPLEPPVNGAPERTIALSFTFRTLPATASAKELATLFPGPYMAEVRARVATSPPKADGSNR